MNQHKNELVLPLTFKPILIMRRYCLTGLLAFLSILFLEGQTVVKLGVGNAALSCSTINNIIEIPVTLANGPNIGGIQFTLKWDPTSLRIINSSGLMQAPFNTGSPGFNYQDSTIGQLRFSWFTSTPTTVGAAAANVFKVKFRVIQPAVSSIQILTNGTVPLEVVSSTQGVMQTMQTVGQITTNDTQPPIFFPCPQDRTISSDTAVAVLGLYAFVDDGCGLKKSEYAFTGARTGSGFTDASGEIFPLGKTTITYTATDFSNNTATCVFAVTVVPTDLTVIAESASPSCGDAFYIDILTENFDSLTTLGFTLNWNPAVVRFDSVSNFEPTLPVNQGDIGQFNVANGQLTFAWFSNTSQNRSLPLGERLFRVWLKAIGGSGATTTVDFGNTPTPILAGSGAPQPQMVTVLTESGIVKITDLQPPTIACPANITVTPAQLNGLPHSISPLLPTVLSDNCGVDQVNYTLSGATGNTGVLAQNTVFQFNAGSTQVIFTAFDEALNATSCQFLVTVQPPVKVDFFIGSDSIACGGQFKTIPVIVNGFQNIETFTLFIACNPAVATIQSIVNSAFPSITFTQLMGGIKVEWSGTAQTLTNGATLFRLQLQSNGQGGSQSALSFSATPSATADFGGQDVAAQTTGINGLVKIFDKTAPTIQNCPTDLVLFSGQNSCTAVGNWTAPTAMDNCSPTVNLTSNFVPGNLFLPSPAPTSVIYTAKDPSGNSATCKFDVYVIDSTAPKIICPQNTTISPDAGLCEATISSLPQPTVSDNCATNLPITDDFTLPKTLGPGVHTFKYFTTDGGNPAQCAFNIFVAADPTITLVACPTDQTVACDDASFITPQPIFSVGCGPLTVTSKNVLASYPLGTTNVVFTAKNYRGDSLLCDFDIKVIDIEKPVIVACPADLTIFTSGTDCSAVVPAIAIPQSPTDNCTDEADLLLSFSPFGPGAVLNIGMVTTTFSVKDEAGNTATCDFKITVLKNPNALPVFLNCPKDTVYQNQCNAQAIWAEPTAVNFCGAAPMISSNFMSGIFIQPSIPQTVIYTATGQNGQTATCQFKLSATDTTAPTILCPGNVTVDVAGNVLAGSSNFLTGAKPWPGCQSVQVFFNAPLGMDNCAGATSGTIYKGLPSSEPLPIGVNPVGFKYTDLSGNMATCDLTITVKRLDTAKIYAFPNPACLGDLVVIWTDSLPKSTFSWSGPSVSGWVSDSNFIQNLTPTSAGPYFVSTTVNGCPAPSSLPYSIEFSRKPDAVNDQETVMAGGKIDAFDVQKNDLLEAGSTYSVTVLNTVNGGTLTETSTEGVFEYQAPGTAIGSVTFSYSVCSDDCPDLCDTAFATIHVKGMPPCEIIPKVITPNGDGFNDQWIIFCIETGLVPNNELYVYNQWGDRVFTAAPYNNDWEGTYKGERLPDGTYFYIFKPSPTTEPIKGFLTIFR